jgi:hypothetical protein
MEYTVKYWEHIVHEVLEKECNVEGSNFDDAYRKFKKNNPFVEIRSFYAN